MTWFRIVTEATSLAASQIAAPVLTVRFMASTASTEITRAFLPHQDRFATSADFAAGVWRDLETDQATLATSAIEHFALTFTPQP